MSETPRYQLRYPDLVDTPDGPAAFEELAEDVESWLSRAYPCTSLTRPAPADGLMIRESDTGLMLVSDGVDWSVINPEGGVGGGGGSVAGVQAQYSATTNQVVDNNEHTALSFLAADVTTPQVERIAFRPDNGGAFGHAFKLKASGLWAISANVRYAASIYDGERYAGIHLITGIASGNGIGEPLAGQGNTFEGDQNRPTTLNSGVTRYFASESIVFVDTYQTTSGDRTLERGVNGGWCRINLALVRS